MLSQAGDAHPYASQWLEMRTSVRIRVLDSRTGHQRKEAGISDEIPASLVSQSVAKSNF